MKRIVLWGLSTLSTVVVLFGYHTSTSSVMASGGETAITGSSKAKAASSTTAGSSSGSSSGSSTVTGDVAQTRYGPVQVQLDVSGGTVTNVSVLQYPNGDGRDVQINQYALPRLIQQTIDSNGANVSMVSGATYTSQGYLQSLQSALDQAGL